MNTTSISSRRSVLRALLGTPTLSLTRTASENVSPDAELMTKSQQLAATVTALEQAGEHDEAMALLEEIEILSNEIAATPASTVQGLCAKVSATAWALLGDFDPMQESSIDGRVTASIMCDLVRLRGGAASAIEAHLKSVLGKSPLPPFR
jgi:hypothetical protein